VYICDLRLQLLSKKHGATQPVEVLSFLEFVNIFSNFNSVRFGFVRGFSPEIGQLHTF
jgi:hypothetical protein